MPPIKPKSGDHAKAAAAKQHQDVDKSSIKQVQENEPAAVIKDKKPAKPAPKSDKEDQITQWAAGSYSVDKKPKKS